MEEVKNQMNTQKETVMSNEENNRFLSQKNVLGSSYSMEELLKIPMEIDEIVEGADIAESRIYQEWEKYASMTRQEGLKHMGEIYRQTALEQRIKKTEKRKQQKGNTDVKMGTEF